MVHLTPSEIWRVSVNRKYTYLILLGKILYCSSEHWRHSLVSLYLSQVWRSSAFGIVLQWPPKGSFRVYIFRSCGVSTTCLRRPGCPSHSYPWSCLRTQIWSRWRWILTIGRRWWRRSRTLDSRFCLRLFSCVIISLSSVLTIIYINKIIVYYCLYKNYMDKFPRFVLRILSYFGSGSDVIHILILPVEFNLYFVTITKTI